MPWNRLDDPVLTAANPGWLAQLPAATGYDGPRKLEDMKPEHRIKAITSRCGVGRYTARQAYGCGLRFCYSGNVCKHGHHDIRVLTSYPISECFSCYLERRERNKADPEWRERHRLNCRRANRRRYDRQRAEKGLGPPDPRRTGRPRFPERQPALDLGLDHRDAIAELEQSGIEW